LIWPIKSDRIFARSDRFMRGLSGVEVLRLG
jgi:hypothetical protein